jgi:hypothetical protein
MKRKVLIRMRYRLTKKLKIILNNKLVKKYKLEKKFNNNLKTYKIMRWKKKLMRKVM